MMLFVDECDAKAHFSRCQIVGRRENFRPIGNPRHWRVRALARTDSPYAH